MHGNGLSAEEDGEVGRDEEVEEERQDALSGNSLTQQVETNQQQALAAAREGSILIPRRQTPKV